MGRQSTLPPMQTLPLRSTSRLVRPCGDKVQASLLCSRASGALCGPLAAWRGRSGQMPAGGRVGGGDATLDARAAAARAGAGSRAAPEPTAARLRHAREARAGRRRAPPQRLGHRAGQPAEQRALALRRGLPHHREPGAGVAAPAGGDPAAAAGGPGAGRARPASPPGHRPAQVLLALLACKAVVLVSKVVTRLALPSEAGCALREPLTRTCPTLPTATAAARSAPGQPCDRLLT